MTNDLNMNNKCIKNVLLITNNEYTMYNKCTKYELLPIIAE